MFPIVLLPEKWRRQYCIAGGYAACPGLAKDCDVWVYGIKTEDLDKVRAELLTWMHAVAPDPVSAGRLVEWKRFHIVESKEESSSPAYVSDNITIKKVADVFGRRGHNHMTPVHLMVTDAQAAGEIIHGFDVSTHAIALDWSGRIYKNQWEGPHRPPERLRNNEKTDGRMQRICERFGHPFVSVPFDPANPLGPVKGRFRFPVEEEF